MVVGITEAVKAEVVRGVAEHHDEETAKLLDRVGKMAELEERLDEAEEENKKLRESLQDVVQKQQDLDKMARAAEKRRMQRENERQKEAREQQLRKKRRAQDADGFRQSGTSCNPPKTDRGDLHTRHGGSR